MIQLLLDSVVAVWRESVLAGVVIVAATAIGWRIGAARDHLMARWVAWWLEHVVRPLMASRGWLRRATIIAANNSLVCVTLVVVGPLGSLAWAAVACVGVSLGIALRLMLPVSAPEEEDGVEATRERRRPIVEGIGLTLNLLEIPAIAISAGLSLGQGAMSSAMALPTALWVFAWVALPLLVVAAAGEALWMSVNPDLPRLWPDP
ncbi:MAG: hypothetical protein JXQ73_10945 [Phycisphaerae bacterium]|nr:hypothetical protein [Phycisphaerae bacterium]